MVDTDQNILLSNSHCKRVSNGHKLFKQKSIENCSFAKIVDLVTVLLDLATV